jgi:hypothetical protein
MKLSHIWIIYNWNATMVIDCVLQKKKKTQTHQLILHLIYILHIIEKIQQ